MLSTAHCKKLEKKAFIFQNMYYEFLVLKKERKKNRMRNERQI